MNEINTLEKLKQCFGKIIPRTDSRTKINPLEFIISLVFSHLVDTKKPSLDAIRRSIKNLTQQDISRSTFWERLSRKRLTHFLRLIITALLQQFGSSVIGGGNLLEQLNVTGILVIDSSSFTLWDGSKDDFPGVSTTASVKLHICFDILTGKLHYFDITPGSTHDRKCFPNLSSLAGKLIIFDLGYWDIGLLWQIKDIGGYDRSRIKSKAVFTVTKIIQGKISQKYLGQTLFSIPFKHKRGNILCVQVEKICEHGTLCCRAVGFWNPYDKCYYWYVTNLTVAAQLIYPLYQGYRSIEAYFI